MERDRKARIIELLDQLDDWGLSVALGFILGLINR